MTDERWTELMRGNNIPLSLPEMLEGWHFCKDWNGLLIGPGMPELDYAPAGIYSCQCKHEDGEFLGIKPRLSKIHFAIFWKFLENNMWGWLTSIMSALFGALFSWGQKQVEKPPEIKDANTPDDIKRGWNSYLGDKLRDKDSDGR